MTLFQLTGPLFQFLVYVNLVVWFGLAVIGIAAITKPNFWNTLKRHLKKFSIPYALAAALVSTLASLWLSDIEGFTPCVLCWYQRIAMYPLVPILAIAWWKKLPVKIYGIILAGIGAIIAFYHILVQNLPAMAGAGPCTAGASCSGQYLSYFGFYSIPVFALCGFATIIVMLLFAKK